MSSESNSAVIRVSPLGWIGLAVFLLSPWAVLLWLAPPSNPILAPRAAPAPKAPARGATGTFEATVVRPGPWGDLSFTRILIEPPEALIPASESVANPSRWFFKGYTPASLDSLWATAGLSIAETQYFNDSKICEVASGGIFVSPDPAHVIALTPIARAKIYTALAEFPENLPQREPFRFQADAIDDWFANAGLPGPILALTHRLLYRRDLNAYFSDHDLVLPQIGSATERLRFIKALSRKAALLVQLRIDHGDDIEGLAHYWGKGRRGKDLRPLLQSFASRANGGTLDIVHLLPPFARSRLYTYPLPSENVPEERRDCHWTSFNFFAEGADERYTDIEFVKKTLLDEYFPIVGAPNFGDIIMLIEPGGFVVHSCVFVADDIVFSKNGSSFSVPWTLARLQNVIALYTRGQPLEQRRYRSKQL